MKRYCEIRELFFYYCTKRRCSQIKPQLKGAIKTLYFCRWKTDFFFSISYLKRQFNFLVAWHDLFFYMDFYISTRTQYTSGITGGQNSYTRKEIFSSKQINWNLWYAIFSTAGSIVYKFCTRPVSRRRHLYSGIFKVPLDENTKSSKID